MGTCEETENCEPPRPPNTFVEEADPELKFAVAVQQMTPKFSSLKEQTRTIRHYWDNQENRNMMYIFYHIESILRSVGVIVVSWLYRRLYRNLPTLKTHPANYLGV